MAALAGLLSNLADRLGASSLFHAGLPRGSIDWIPVPLWPTARTNMADIVVALAALAFAYQPARRAIHALPTHISGMTSAANGGTRITDHAGVRRGGDIDGSRTGRVTTMIRGTLHARGRLAAQHRHPRRGRLDDLLGGEPATRGPGPVTTRRARPALSSASRPGAHRYTAYVSCTLNHRLEIVATTSPSR